MHIEVSDINLGKSSPIDVLGLHLYICGKSGATILEFGSEFSWRCDEQELISPCSADLALEVLYSQMWPGLSIHSQVNGVQVLHPQIQNYVIYMAIVKGNFGKSHWVNSLQDNG